MQYSNYDMKNNVHATLSTAVSSVATTIQLTSWQWSRFWTTFPQIATLESFDENWKVIKREIVKITWRSGDNLTVVRAFAPCPENDDANSQTQNAISFNADDTISLYIPKEIFDKISDSLNDIYDNWTNNMRTEIVSWLQVQVNPWQVMVWSAYYDFSGWTITLTDNATNYLEIDEDWLLANNTTTRNDQNTKLAIITTSSGSVTNIKDRRLWTIGWKIGGVNIHDLTEKTSLSSNDEFIIADSDNIYNNKKLKYSTIKNILTNKTLLAEKKFATWNDIVSIWDSQDNYENKKTKVSNLREWLPFAYQPSNYTNSKYIGDWDFLFWRYSSWWVFFNRLGGTMSRQSEDITYVRAGLWTAYNFVWSNIYNWTVYVYLRWSNTQNAITKNVIWNSRQWTQVFTTTTNLQNCQFLWFDWTYFAFAKTDWTIYYFDESWNLVWQHSITWYNWFVANNWRVVIMEWSQTKTITIYDNITTMNVLKQYNVSDNSYYLSTMFWRWNYIYFWVTTNTSYFYIQWNLALPMFSID